MWTMTNVKPNQFEHEWGTGIKASAARGADDQRLPTHRGLIRDLMVGGGGGAKGPLVGFRQ